jgi:hypothetical protein
LEEKKKSIKLETNSTETILCLQQNILKYTINTISLLMEKQPESDLKSHQSGSFGQIPLIFPLGFHSFENGLAGVLTPDVQARQPDGFT